MREGEAERLAVVVGVGDGESDGVDDCETVGELLGVRVIEGEDEGDGVADGCV